MTSALAIIAGRLYARPMSTPRRTLSIKPATDLGDQPRTPAADILAEAIRRKLCVTAIYNKTPMQIAPHILYTKHDEPFLDGVVVLRDGKVPAEPKLGTFKLTGLNSLSLTLADFTINPLFNPADAKYEGVTLTFAKG